MDPNDSSYQPPPPPDDSQNDPGVYVDEHGQPHYDRPAEPQATQNDFGQQQYEQPEPQQQDLTYAQPADTQQHNFQVPSVNQSPYADDESDQNIQYAAETTSQPESYPETNPNHQQPVTDPANYPQFTPEPADQNTTAAGEGENWPVTAPQSGAVDLSGQQQYQQPEEASTQTDAYQPDATEVGAGADEQNQQSPWWEMPPPEESSAANTQTSEAELPLNREDAGYDMPTIQNYRRRRPEEEQNYDAQPEATTAPAPPPQPQPTLEETHAPEVSELPYRQPVDSPAADAARGQEVAAPEAEQPQQQVAPQADTTGEQPPQLANRQPEHGTYHLPGEDQTQTPAAPVTAETPTPEPAGNSLKNKLGSIFSKLKQFNYKPAVSAAIIGIIIFGIFNSQVIIGQVQYLTTPTGGLNTASNFVDADAPVGEEPKIIIPRINVDVPVVYDEPSFDEDKVQAALERGVVHYGNTAMPGERGNSVIVGHSSNNWWDSGKYKFAFILLDKLEDGDEIVLHYEGERYVYEVDKKFVVEPTDVSVLAQTDDPILTLITCTPPGTSWQRLIVQARQVSPDPDQSVEISRQPTVEAGALPSDSTGSGFLNFVRNLF